MTVSACIITWNEEEMLPGLLFYLNSVQHLDEICILDSNSTDRTQEMLRGFNPADGKKFTWETCEFAGFGVQRQRNLDMASGDWLWFFDADEVVCNMDDLLSKLPQLAHINTVQFPGLVMCLDRKHAVCDPHGVFIHSGHMVPKMVRRGFARFTPERKCHEQLIDINGRILYGWDNPAPDILRTKDVPEFKDIFVKHMQALKSRAARAAKGQRWLETGMITESHKHGIPVYPSWWAEADERFKREIDSGCYTIKPIPKQYYDVTTELF